MAYTQCAPAYASHHNDGQYSQYGPYPVTSSTRSFVTTWLLALLVGTLGLDRFYLGKLGTGLLKLVTFGGLGVWALVDLVAVLCGAGHDKDGLPLAGYREHRLVAWTITAVVTATACGVSWWAYRNGYSDGEIGTYQY
ncbi:MAG: TM2 domain-containing protein [Micrococcales bacterium]|nr:TM2 domain-containing protein [Micrococcales bacterium]MCL2666100.1 TM2 domain-containing protein [Micrococcales bacterium]